MSLSLVAYGDSSGSESEPEDGPVSRSNNQSAKEDVRKLLSVLPAPRGGGKGSKQPVRIGLPQLDKGDDESDEEDAPAVKRQKSGGSSLTALLPQPKGAVRTLGGANKTTKSSMVPYSLMKKRQQAKAAMKSKAAKMKAKKDNNTSDGSDSDEDPVSFFTHLEVKPDVQSHSGTISQSDSDTTGQSSITPVVNAVKEYPPMNEDTGSISLGEATSYQATTDYSQLYSYAGQYDTDVPSYGNYSQGMQEYPSEGDGSVQGWYSEQYAGTEMTQQQGETIMPGVGPGLSVDEDVFRRLAGGSKRRNRDENLNNILDINENDVKEGIKTYQKYHTEESVNKLYKPDLSKTKAPTGMQKRKHQLSYLAHEAKARELELRNHWAQSAQTRRQTQMKYGF